MSSLAFTVGQYLIDRSQILNAITFNLPFYFLVNLRREPGPFFFFLFISFISTLAMVRLLP